MTRATRRRIRRGAGFTIVELMVALTIAAVLATLAVPAMLDAVLSARLSGYANTLLVSSHLARSEAIKRNAVVTLCASEDRATCSAGTWNRGWIILAGETVIQVQEASATGYRFSGTVDRIDYQPTGVGATMATVTLCRSAPSAGHLEKVVRVSATGRASVSTTHTGVCS